MAKEFHQFAWDESVQDDCRQLVRLAVREDLDRGMDVTTLALVDRDTAGLAFVVARQPGVVCGLLAAELALHEMEIDATWTPHISDGGLVSAGTRLATLAGPARDMLTAERLLLNLIGRLSGIATLTGRYVAETAGTGARIYDTRKTTPGWRRLEKYAVRCGGAQNHRSGLYDAVLIKDNHLALVGQNAESRLSPAAAVIQARTRLRELAPGRGDEMIVEIEVDSLDQLAEVLPQQPDIVLLDNMSTDLLEQAVALRNSVAAQVQLEASGGVNLKTVAAIARTGVDRISVGGLTHSAISLDVALDWALDETVD